MRDSFGLYKESRLSILPILDVFLYNYHEIKEMPNRPVDRPMIHYWLHSWLPNTKEDKNLDSIKV